MDLSEFRNQSIKEKVGLVDDNFGRIYSFVDFGNVNYWFEKDIRDCDEELLNIGEKLCINLEKLSEFLNAFSSKTFFYYGLDPRNSKSVGFIDGARNYYDKVNSKPIQKIKHYLSDSEAEKETRDLCSDLDGNYIYIPKCNFDVEISVDAMRLVEHYDTICLLSSDADFVRLLHHLKREKKKKIILVKGGFIQYDLAQAADILVNAQDIKSNIAVKKQKSSVQARFADRDPVSTGRAI